jgi:hypothetical protein
VDPHFPDSEKGLRELVCKWVSVTPQTVAIAKDIILSESCGPTNSQDLIDAVAAKHKVLPPQEITLHKNFDSTASIRSLSDYISWRLSAAEAVLSLLSTGFLVPVSDSFYSLGFHAAYFQGWPGSGGGRGSVTFSEFHVMVPARVRLATSFLGGKDQYLAEPDLFLQTLGIPNMHREVETALREAVKCFRHELYTAAVAMLGKASEGAWIELGTFLLEAVPEPLRASVKKQREVLDDPMAGTMRKIQAVIQLYERDAIYSSVYVSSGIKPPELRGVMDWSDLVRDSRNTIHFGVKPATPDTQEKVAVFLLGVAPRLKVIYSLKAAVDSSPPPLSVP